MTANAEQRFERRLERLQAIVESMEKGALDLEQGVALYKEGLDLARSCREQLDKARNEITVYSQGAFEPFVDPGGAKGEQGADE